MSLALSECLVKVYVCLIRTEQLWRREKILWKYRTVSGNWSTREAFFIHRQDNSEWTVSPVTASTKVNQEKCIVPKICRESCLFSFPKSIINYYSSFSPLFTRSLRYTIIWRLWVFPTLCWSIMGPWTWTPWLYPVKSSDLSCLKSQPLHMAGGH